jgi:hypothetical protein
MGVSSLLIVSACESDGFWWIPQQILRYTAVRTGNRNRTTIHYEPHYRYTTTSEVVSRKRPATIRTHSYTTCTVTSGGTFGKTGKQNNSYELQPDVRSLSDVVWIRISLFTLYYPTYKPLWRPNTTVANNNAIRNFWRNIFLHLAPDCITSTSSTVRRHIRL